MKILQSKSYLLHTILANLTWYIPSQPFLKPKNRESRVFRVISYDSIKRASFFDLKFDFNEIYCNIEVPIEICLITEIAFENKMIKIQFAKKNYLNVFLPIIAYIFPMDDISYFYLKNYLIIKL